MFKKQIVRNVLVVVFAVLAVFASAACHGDPDDSNVSSNGANSSRSSDGGASPSSGSGGGASNYTYTVTFDKNGGDTEASPATKTVAYPATTVDALPTPPTHADYAFEGWATAPDGGTEFTANTPVTADITVYAQWGNELTTENHTLVWIKPSTFQMGSPTTELDRLSNETQHLVTLTRGFYMGKYPVTQELYQAVMGSNPSYFQSNPTNGEVQAKRPVEYVLWYETLVFCNKLSALEKLTPVYSIKSSTDTTVWGNVPVGSDDATWNAVTMSSTANGYRLPTEAEWEYACRANTTTAYSFGDDASSLGNYAWYSANSGSGTHEVGKKPANAWGLYDMHGNVWEWCWDWFGTYATGAVTDPLGADAGTWYSPSRVVRGGGWNSEARNLRSAVRNYIIPNGIYRYLGFRVVRLAS